MRHDKDGRAVPESEVLRWIKGVLDRMRAPGSWVIPRSRLLITKQEDGSIVLEDTTEERYLGIVADANKAESDESGSVIRDQESLDTAARLWGHPDFEAQRAQDIADMMEFIPLAKYDLSVSLSEEAYEQLESEGHSTLITPPEQETDENA